MTLTLPGKWPSLNQYIAAERTHRMAGAKMKAEYTDIAYFACISQNLPLFKRPVKIHFVWYSTNRRMDTDNIRWCKPILDGLVLAGVLPDDSQRWVQQLSDTFLVDKDNPRVEVEIKEVE